MEQTIEKLSKVVTIGKDALMLLGAFGLIVALKK